MIPYFNNIYSNPSSSHGFGLLAKNVIEKTRKNVADIVQCNPNEIYFTSGATESLNMSIIGYCLKNQEKGNHIISVKTEHHAVLDTLKYLSTIGFDIDLLSVDKNGLIDLNELKSKITPNTILISIMYVNNETGVIQTLTEISEVAHYHNIPLLSDLTQSIGKITINLQSLGIDIGAFSAHKFHGPKGIGVLYIKNGLTVSSSSFGGGQENNLRSGTLNTPGVFGLGKALEIASSNLVSISENIHNLRNKLESELIKITNSKLNGDINNRVCNISNICFQGRDVTRLLIGVDNIIVSNGSACTSSVIEPSHVLRAMGLSDSECNSSVRFSLSKFTNEVEIDTSISMIKEILH